MFARLSDATPLCSRRRLDAARAGLRQAEQPARAGPRPPAGGLAHVLGLGGCPLLAADAQVGQGDRHASRLAALDQRLRGVLQCDVPGVTAGKCRWR